MRSSNLGMGSRLATRVLSNFLSDSLLEDPVAARQGRLVVGISIICAVSIGVALPLRFSVAESEWLAFALVSLGGLCAAPLVLRLTGSVRLAGTLSVLSFSAGMLVIAYHEGGLESPVLFATPIVPLMAALMIDHRSGWVAAAGVVSACVATLVFTKSGLELPDSGFDEQQIALLQAMAASISALMVISLISFSEREKQEAGKKLRAAERSASLATQAKSQFLAQTSHQVREPMAGVMGLVDLLLELDLPPEAWDHARRLSSSAESLRRILHENLDVSKIETGDVVFEIRSFSLRGAVSEMVEMLRPAAIAKGIALEAKVDPTVDDRRKGDLHRLRQVLLNLLGNAVKFTQQGRIDLLIEPGDEPGGVRFTVKDTGVGLTPEQQEQIFRPARGTADASRRMAGLELGLSISRQIAELMGGSIRVASSPESGSTFTFTAALAEAPGRPERPDSVSGYHHES